VARGVDVMTFRLLPRIDTVFDVSEERAVSHLYAAPIRHALRRILNDDRFFSEIFEDEIKEECLQELHRSLPIVKWAEWGDENPKNLSIFLLAAFRPNVGKFFYDMISRWLMPGKKLNIGLFFSTDFTLPDFSDQLYSLSKIVVCLENAEDIETIRSHLLIIENEICLGVASVFHANRILEVKGLSLDEKTALIQERIGTLIHNRPRRFDYDLFGEMQHFLVMCKDEFKSVREVDQMTRMIYILYLFRTAMRKETESDQTKRHLHVKLVKTRLHYALGIKKVLGVFVGMNLLKDNEVFEERHLLKALQSCLSELRCIEDSFFIHMGREDAVHTMYIEVEKDKGEDFSLSDLKKLRRELPSALQNSVEHLMRPIFMPRNEEEVMRNIVTLANQLRYPKDLPQVMISFDEQTASELSFTVIVLRLLYPDSVTVSQLFNSSNTRLRFSLEKTKIVGMLRKKYPKEVAVFRVKLSDKGFVRGDQTVDFYKARKEVSEELERLVGEFRDYNGGMISKQVELFMALKDSLGECGQKLELLLENFFHSIFPVEMKSVLRPDPLRQLFLLLVQMTTDSGEEKKSFISTCKREEPRVFVMIQFKDQFLRQEMVEAVAAEYAPSAQLVSISVSNSDFFYLGYVYFSDETEKQNQFLKHFHFEEADSLHGSLKT
jgi:hypothetical protein